MPNELHIPVGSRVRFVETFENYPWMIMSGATGVVHAYKKDGAERWLEVKLDLQEEGLEEWDNCIWVFEWVDLPVNAWDPPYFDDSVESTMVPAPWYLEVIREET